MTKTLTYNTGRIYNGEQTLEITVTPLETPGEFGEYNASLKFVDASRNISGIIPSYLIFSTDTPQEVCRACLSMYDKGNYQLV